MMAEKKKMISVPIEMYDLEQAARYLGVHPRTVNREINRGNLEGYAIGRGFRVKRSELDRYVEQRKIGRKVSPRS
jgi:excisionase family DNA binding protein